MSNGVTFKINDSSLKRAFSDIAKFDKKTRAKIGAQVEKSIYQIHGDAFKSSPVDTRFMRNNLFVSTEKQNGNVVSGKIDPKARYTIYVHEGTSRMTGRPFLRNAFNRYKKDFVKSIEQIIKKT